MSSYKSIGGYFELESSLGNNAYHSNCISLNTARNCFEYILLAKKYTKIYLPKYICDVMLEPIKKHHLSFDFYSIDKNLEPVFAKDLDKNEVFLYCNYFGIKNNTVKKLTEKIPNLIIDNSQSFFSVPIATDTFYSARKFFGVADGAYLYTDTFLHENFDTDLSSERMLHLLKRFELGPEAGYSEFVKSENLLVNSPIKLMSKITENILNSINYDKSKKQRILNYQFLHEKLGSINELNVDLNLDDVPMVYPFLLHSENLKQEFINHKVFVATYWKNVFDWASTSDFEFYLAKNLIPIPIDQRYNVDDMDYIVQLIDKYTHSLNR